jgi:hypothetical protein
MKYQCPKCQREIYNRRNKFCGFCGMELPKEILFSPEELLKIDQEEAQVKAQIQLVRAERDAEEEKQQRAASANSQM